MFLDILGGDEVSFGVLRDWDWSVVFVRFVGGFYIGVGFYKKFVFILGDRFVVKEGNDGGFFVCTVGV